ncbi:AbrB/MazE/SpoVT family DNA-binding domain-containing protein [Peribacillus sp. SCS-26]|uniref:AbrB/MazE/SpoVT family DNA-binding domain-containing protein n=1 Tax=Paraperibacillus marinus TaxID=3115295 RepID=UPI0039061EC1
MKRSIVKVGNSLGIRIPSPLLEEFGVTYKDEVEIEYNKEADIIIISKEKITNNLETLIRGVVEQYIKEKGSD